MKCVILFEDIFVRAGQVRRLELRREVHEGLNVIESWNGANDFILYGRGGEIATNRLET